MMCQLFDFKLTLAKWIQKYYFNSEVFTKTEVVFTINKEVITPVCCFCYFYLTAMYEKKEFYNLSCSSAQQNVFLLYLAYFLLFSRKTMEAFHQACWKQSLRKCMFFSGFLLSLTSLKVVLYLPSLMKCFAIIFSMKWILYVPSSAILCHHLFTVLFSGGQECNWDVLDEASGHL